MTRRKPYALGRRRFAASAALRREYPMRRAFLAKQAHLKRATA